MEYRSDLVGERAILLGAPWGISEAIYSTRVADGVLPIEAFAQSAMCITGPISQAISDGGLLEVARRIAEHLVFGFAIASIAVRDAATQRLRPEIRRRFGGTAIALRPER